MSQEQQEWQIQQNSKLKKRRKAKKVLEKFAVTG